MDQDYPATFIDRPEGRLCVVRAGDRGRPVLLLSGAGVDNAMLSWRYLLPVLGEDHRVFALDWPKQGRSRPWTGHAGIDIMRGCITEVYEHFDIDQADLVGLSQGGALLLDYAIRWPDRVRRLVALAPAGILSFPPVIHQLLWLSAKLDPVLSRLSTLMFRSRRAVVWLARRSLFAGPVADFDDVVDEILQEVREHGAGASDLQNDSIGPLKMRLDLRPRLHKISCPTLLIQGDKDVAVRAKRTIEAATLIPGARLELLKGHGHWSNRQSPELVNNLIAGFLSSSLD